MAFPLQGDDAYQSIAPTPLPDPYWVGFSPSLGRELGIDLNESGLPADPLWLNVLSGNALASKKHVFSNPIATAYSGHQFGIWAGQLGDGRAILLGDIGPYEIQLKGSGITRYSRMGDGRAVLRSSIREFLGSEAMHALGVPTSRALAVTGSKKPVMRETLETAAVCTRLAPSFLRVGHFEHYAAARQTEHLQQLAEYLLDIHYQECRDSDDPYLSLFSAISRRHFLSCHHPLREFGRMRQSGDLLWAMVYQAWHSTAHRRRALKVDLEMFCGGARIYPSPRDYSPNAFERHLDHSNRPLAD